MHDHASLPESVWQPWLRSRSMVAVLAVAGMVFTLAVSGWLLWLDYRGARLQFEEELEDRARHLHAELRQSMESLYTLREVIRYTDSLPDIVFNDVAEAALARNAHVVVLEWAPRVPHADRGRFEAGLPGTARIDQLDDDGRRYPAPVRDEYLPLRFVAPLAENVALIGVDLAGRPRRLRALMDARDQGRLTMSAPLALLQEAHQGKPGVVVALPVYRGRPETIEERRVALRGFVLAVIDVERLVTRIFPDLPQQRWLRIQDQDDDSGGVLLQHGRPTAHQHDVRLEEFAGRHWQLAMSPAWQALSLDLLLLPLSALLVGTLLVIIVCGYLWLLQRRSELVEQVVDARTLELREANQRLASLSVTDPLTGLANRRALDDYLAQEWQRALREKQPLTLLLLDVDHFKHLNDSRGHPAGDACLREVATLMRTHFKRPADLVARFGGEEFAVVLPNTDHAAMEQANRFRDALSRYPIDAGVGESLYITISGGLATLVPAPGQSPRDLIKRADQALYEAKGAGRNRIMAG